MTIFITHHQPASSGQLRHIFRRERAQLSRRRRYRRRYSKHAISNDAQKNTRFTPEVGFLHGRDYFLYR